MSNENGAPSAVLTALQEVAQWRQEAEDRHQMEVAEVDREMDSLRKAVSNLQQQLEALAKFRDELGGKTAGMDDEQVSRSYEAIFGALQGQSSTLQARSQEVAEAEAARTAALADAMKDSAVAPLFAEYEDFKNQVEPTMDALPESARRVLLAHYETVADKLRQHIGRAAGGMIEVGTEWIDLDVVYSVDNPEDEPGILMVVLPISAETHTGWADRQEDLQTWIAARTVQALWYEFRGTVLEAASPMFGGHQGMLALEVELGEDVPEGFGDRIKGALSSVYGAAPEIGAAKVRIGVQFVDADHLLPPEEEEEAGVA